VHTGQRDSQNSASIHAITDPSQGAFQLAPCTQIGIRTIASLISQGEMPSWLI
jgi:hypothetical protein